MSLFRSQLVPVLCVTVFCTAAQADVVRLKGGGEVRGRLQDAGQGTGVTSVKTRSGATITLPSDEIDFVSRRSPLVEEYVTRSRQTDGTVESHLALAEWCRTQGLLEERQEQLEQVLDLDPDHPDARRVLGYVRHLGRWLTQDDVMTGRGYVRHDGRWVTRQELQLIESNSARKTAELAWMPKVRLWVGWLTGPNQERRLSGLAELQKVQDPEAVSALANFMSKHNVVDVRLLFVQILRQIEGSRPVIPLVERVLMDDSDAVREQALGAVMAGRAELALPALISALKNKSNLVICRAASALGEIGDPRAVPALIDALVTTHTYTIQVPANGTTFASGNGVFSGAVPPDVEIAARTGQLPYGANILPDPTTPRIMRSIPVTENFKNAPVLQALEKITTQNLGYNERDWHLWWAIQKG
ncbi:HEAT repeat domain-containing protein [Planctomicrobium piriforme]|uniref:HEAT repeat-containing protein n=1 Tax=Planctomicrobium piriforme TaxID=1576369 RepID=A0A1I3FV80_9PLAN|nr:HEAT repeat domain-containing protein [Planctomicrobium piriforme]SFI15085.1 HEAT repeat-containing protein [Planctomicrobium piriforme]